jgi:hypothetical protein
MLLSSFGCVYRCTFCPMSGIATDRYRAHSARYFVDMLAHFAAQYQQRHFIFGDNLFTQDAGRAQAICRDIAERGLDVEWICMTRTDHVEDDLLRSMRAAGCVEIVFGVESCSERIQQSIRKRLDLDSVQPALEGCDRAGIRSVMSLMVGNPGESEHSVYETLRRVRELEPDEAQVKITKLYPGTALHERAEQAGAIPADFYLAATPQPLPFTVEHDAQTLERLAAMIQPRTLHVETTGRGSDREGHGSQDDAATERSSAELQRDLLRIARRGFAVRLCRETARRDDAVELVRFASSLRIPTLELGTDGRVFADRDRSTPLLAAGGVDRFVVSLPTSDEQAYERAIGVPGSFAPAMAGLDRLLAAAPGRVALEVELCEHTLPTLAQTVSFALDREVERIEFRYAPGGHGHGPVPRSVGEHLCAALLPLRPHDATVWIEGLPYCDVPGLEHVVAEIHRPFDERIDLAGRLLNVGKERRQRRTKTARCDECRHEWICEGFWLLDVQTSKAGGAP